MRATLLSEVADIGYNATKKIHYDGLKFSVLVSDSGFPIDYVSHPHLFMMAMLLWSYLKIAHFQSFMGIKDMWIDRQRQRWQTVVSS